MLDKIPQGGRNYADIGKSKGIRLSKEIPQAANIAIDDVLEVNISNGIITLTKPFRHKTLEKPANRYNLQVSLANV